MSTSKVSKITVGGPDAPNNSKFIISSSNIHLSYGNVIDGITVDGTHIGGKGANSAGLNLEPGEYWTDFYANSDPGYMGGVVTAMEFVTNKGRSVAANVKKLPNHGGPTKKAIITDCLIYGIELISGDFINQITVHYISDFKK